MSFMTKQANLLLINCINNHFLLQGGFGTVTFLYGQCICQCLLSKNKCYGVAKI